MRALAAFGAPLADLTTEDLAVPGTIFQIGIEPNRIDILTSIEGIQFAEAWERGAGSTHGDVPIAILGLEDLLRNKRAVARPQDLLDVERLEQRRSPPVEE